MLWLDCTDCTVITKLPEKSLLSQYRLIRENTTLSIPAQWAWDLYPSVGSWTLWVFPYLAPSAHSLCHGLSSQNLQAFPGPPFCRPFSSFRFHFQYHHNREKSLLPSMMGRTMPLQRGLFSSPWKFDYVILHGGRDFPRMYKYFETWKLSLIIKVNPKWS